MKFLMVLLFATFLFGQYEEVTNEIFDIMNREGLIRSDIDKQEIIKRLNYELVEKVSYKEEDLCYGMAQSLVSGFALGVYESNAFGYKYPDLPNNDIKKYLTWNKVGDGVFSKILTPQKVFREVDHYTDGKAWINYNKYYANNFLYSYITHFFFKNLSATMVRDYAKHGKLFKSFSVDLILKY